MYDVHVWLFELGNPSFPGLILYSTLSLIAMLLISAQICVTTIKPEVQITRKCLAQVRARVAVADLAFTTSEFARTCNSMFLLLLDFYWLASFLYWPEIQERSCESHGIKILFVVSCFLRFKKNIINIKLILQNLLLRSLENLTQTLQLVVKIFNMVKLDHSGECSSEKVQWSIGGDKD